MKISEFCLGGNKSDNKSSEIKGWTVSNGSASFSAIEFGCTITNLFVPDKNGQKIDVLLGFDDFDGWKNGTASHNAVVGRFANRIGGASFILGGKKYLLDKNNGENCLHGGFFRFEKQIWKGEPFKTDDEGGIVFSRTSPDGEQNFPGNLKVKVIYSLNKKNQLKIEYFAETDAPTPVNLTNHAYFNLDGEGDVLSHIVCLDSEKILELKNMIPTGKILDVSLHENKAFDFRNPKKIAEDFSSVKKDPATRGYDHCFATKADETKIIFAGFCESENSGIKMNIYTNQRGIQLYTGNWLNCRGKNGKNQHAQSGICFEAQRFPDSMNHENFPGCILHPGEEYHQTTIYEFPAQS